MITGNTYRQVTQTMLVVLFTLSAFTSAAGIAGMETISRYSDPGYRYFTPHHPLPSEASVPVLPYPQQVVAGTKPLSYPVVLSFNAAGLSKEALEKLQSNWKEFVLETNPFAQTAGMVTLQLIAKEDSAFNKISQINGDKASQLGKEGYILICNAAERKIIAHTETGLFYGLQTLKQLTRAKYTHEITIADWPDYETRVIYDDISRGPISTVEYIKEQIRRLAEIKINYLSFYIEHVVETISHPDFAPANGKLTIADIKALSAYAAQYHIQLIGSFQSFGHFEKILALPAYQSMGETSTLLSPLDPSARKFLSDVIGELCDAFSAPWFNVNCDETFDLTKGRSKAYIDSIGAARFYADHLQFLYDVVKKHGKQMMMWGDVALEHPEIIDRLPDDVVYLTWEYGNQRDYSKWIKAFAERKRPFMVCPGILNSYRMFPDMLMAKANIDGFLKAGKANGASGAFTTIWDDGVAYLFSGVWYGVYVAAEKSWKLDNTAASFDTRYESTAYGTSNGGYVTAMNTLMQLRALPLTYNLNDLLWPQAILPEKGQSLLLNNTSVPAAMAILTKASTAAATAKPLYHKTDLQTLQLTIRQYQLMLRTRTALARIAGIYRQVQEGVNIKGTSATNHAQLTKARTTVDSLAQAYQALKETFIKAWQRENQPYWLDRVQKPYENKIAALSQLSTSLQSAALFAQTGKPLQPVDSIRLQIIETPYSYFGYWMLTGPFPAAAGQPLPAFLYADETEYNKPPVPGDFTTYNHQRYRWQKFASPNGGLIDLDKKFGGNAPSVVYAYCMVKVHKAIATEAFVKSPAGTAVYCNSKEAGLSSKPLASGETKINLSLQEGINHILLKIPHAQGMPWQFMFRLAPDLEVINHKYKYQTNDKNNVYDAE